MKKLALTFALAGLVLGSEPRLATGHGGTYRGPGDVVPPGGGGYGGGGGARPSGPSSGPQGPGGPKTGGGRGSGPVRGPGGSNNGPLSSRGTGGDDLTRWEFWWVYNKEPYLDLKRAIHAAGAMTGSDDWWIGRGELEDAGDRLRPSAADVHERIVPALLDILAQEKANDVQSGALIALARIGELTDESGAGEHGLVRLFSEYLSDGSQEVRETAALSLGILGVAEAVDPLTALARDTREGRKLVSKAGRAEGSVDERTRAFATFALGLAGKRLTDPSQRARIVATTIALLNGDARTSARRDLAVAALSTFGLVPLEHAAAPAEPIAEEPVTRAEQAAWLLAFYDDDTIDPRVRAHVPAALQRLLQPGDARTPFTNELDRAMPELKAQVCERLLADLSPHAKVENELVQSAALALGRLGDAGDGALDRRIVDALAELPEHVADLQARRFALIALGSIGARPGLADESRHAQTERIRTELLRALSKGSTPARPWAALALGVLENAWIESTGLAPSSDVVAALRNVVERSRSSEHIGAFALALGLCGDAESKAALLRTLESTSEPGARGYVAIALGLLGEAAAIEPIQRVLAESRFRSELLRSAAIALGMLGDKQVGESLVSMLETAESLSSQAALAKALGFIGDVRSIDPLLATMQNPDLTPRARGLAAAALGLVGERGELPWSTPLSIGLNYRAATPTLVDPGGSAGILDLL